MKKLTTLIVAIVMSFTLCFLAACETPNDNPQDNAEYTTIQAELEISNAGAPIGKIVASLYFKKVGDDVDVIGKASSASGVEQDGNEIVYEFEETSKVAFYYIDGKFAATETNFDYPEGVDPSTDPNAVRVWSDESVMAYTVGKLSELIKQSGADMDEITQALDEIKVEYDALLDSLNLSSMDAVLNFEEGGNNVDIAQSVNAKLATIKAYLPLTFGDALLKYINDANATVDGYVPLTEEDVTSAIEDALVTGTTVQDAIDAIEASINGELTDKEDPNYITIKEIFDGVQTELNVTTAQVIDIINAELVKSAEPGTTPTQLPAPQKNDTIYDYIVDFVISENVTPVVTLKDMSLDVIAQLILNSEEATLADLATMINTAVLFPEITPPVENPDPNVPPAWRGNIESLVVDMIGIPASLINTVVDFNFKKLIVTGYVNFNGDNTLKNLGFGTDFIVYDGEIAAEEKPLAKGKLTVEFDITYDKPTAVEFTFPQEYEDDVILGDANNQGGDAGTSGDITTTI